MSLYIKCFDIEVLVKVQSVQIEECSHSVFLKKDFLSLMEILALFPINII